MQLLYSVGNWFKMRRPLCSCSNVINSFDCFDSLSVFCSFVSSSGPYFHYALSIIEQSAKNIGQWNKLCCKSFCWSFTMTIVLLLRITLVEKPTLLSCVQPGVLHGPWDQLRGNKNPTKIQMHKSEVGRCVHLRTMCSKLVKLNFNHNSLSLNSSI